ncbi:MAG: hypothetical protein IJ455_06620 [Agathobacter sp.]|nr:hypothetical protein [Agathobacter sp.]
MVLTRQVLEDYQKLGREIARINKKIDYYANTPLKAIHGIVKGSTKGFPYTERRIEVGAPSIADTKQREQKVRELMICLASRKKEYEQLKFDIDIAIEAIEDMEMRQIFQYRYIDEMTILEIGELLGYDRSTISKKIDRFLEKQVSPTSHF